MADKWPLANGNWSTAANWNGGTKPGAGDDVFADGKTVTIDEDVTVLSIRTTQRSGGTANGNFNVANTNGLTITTSGLGIIAGASNVLIVAQNTGFILAINGNVTGGSTTTGAIYHQSGSTINIVGDVVGASRPAVFISATGIVNITGNVLGGSSTTGYSIQTNTGVVSVTGDVTASVAEGILCTGASSITVTGNITAATSRAGVASTNPDWSLTHYGTTHSNTSGQSAIGYGKQFISPTASVTRSITTTSFTLRNLSTAGTNQAATTDVRDGIIYGGGTGTLAVPDPQYVSQGVPIDATVGTLEPSLDAAALRAALGMSSANLDTQLAGIAVGTDRIPAVPATESTAAAAQSASESAAADAEDAKQLAVVIASLVERHY